MELVEHWWNGTMASRPRRDIELLTDGTRWRLDVRAGGSMATPWTRTYPTEAAARELLDTIKARSGDEWKDITRLYRPR